VNVDCVLFDQDSLDKAVRRVSSAALVREGHQALQDGQALLAALATQAQLVRLGRLVSLAHWALRDSQASSVVREHRELLVSKELREILARQDLLDLLDRRVLLELLVRRVSLGHREQRERQEELDSQVIILTVFFIDFVLSR